MEITFDPKKDSINRAAHGVSLAEARHMDWDHSVDWLDKRYDYDEERMCALGMIGRQIYFVAYVDRDDGRRIISLRRANKQEVLNYAQQVR